jgi:hypothetical protein
LRDIVFVFERNSHESGLKMRLFQDYRTIFRVPQAFAIASAAFPGTVATLLAAALAVA